MTPGRRHKKMKQYECSLQCCTTLYDLKWQAAGKVGGGEGRGAGEKGIHEELDDEESAGA